jgi:putative redox protein
MEQFFFGMNSWNEYDRCFAKQQNFPLEKVEVKITHQKRQVADRKYKADVFSKEIILYGDKLSEEQRKKLIAISAKCPIHRSLEGQPIIETKSN